VPFDRKKADRAVAFFERYLKHGIGKYAGAQFLLDPWQAEIIRTIFGTLKDDGTRQISTAYVEIPKKNGKTELAAGIALYLLTADGEPAAEVYGAASCREQAGIVFRAARRMVQMCPPLRKRLEVVGSTKTIVYDATDSFYRAISADAGNQDGINPSGVIFDELHRQKNADLWDILTLGGDTREQMLTFATTTAGVMDESPLCWSQHEYADQILRGVIKNPSYYPVIYAAGEKDDWADPKTWAKANPALGSFLKLDKVREAALEAKGNPAALNKFLRFRLNRWVQQETRWIPIDQWDLCAGKVDRRALRGARCFAGLDLSTSIDLTALALVFPHEDGSISILPHFWMPESAVRERAKKDGVPYDRWVESGLIEATSGNTVDYTVVKRRVLEYSKEFDIVECGFDVYNANQTATELNAEGVQMVPVRQTTIGLNAACKDLERRWMDRTMRHAGNEVLRWMADCVSVKEDGNGLMKPVKPSRHFSRKRIDGIAAVLNAIARLIVHGQSPIYSNPSVYVL
jgi:phage terminase large subunit-like protein